MSKMASFVLGSVLGAVVGSGLALLFAPSSGVTLQSQLNDSINRLSGEVRQAATDRRKEMENELNLLRQNRYKLE